MTSFLSKEVLTVDIPDPRDVKADFTYVYYTPDESLVDSSKLNPLARYVTVSFDSTPIANRTSITNDKFVSLLKNGLINPEYAITTPGMTSLTVEDIDVGRRLQDFTMRKLSKLFPNVDLNTSEMSQTDLADALNNATSSRISRNIILDLVSDFSSDGITFYDRSDKEIKDDIFVDAASVKFDAQINEKFIGDFYRNMSFDPLNSNHRAAILNSDEAIAQQETTRRNSSPALSPEDYVPDIRYVKKVKVQKHDAVPKISACGHIIDRYSIDEFGDRVPGSLASFFVRDVKSKNYVDTQVVYGAVYVYEVRTLAVVEMTVGGDVLEDAGTGKESDIFRITFFVTSRASSQAKVKCIENIPPPPPSICKFRFDFELNRLGIKWDFPHTSQQDIKKFQIFKRASIYQPFVLIAQYDFTDAYVPAPEIERIDPALNFEMSFGRKMYYDEDFDKSGDAIYAIVSVDAHNLTSNYSDQIRVKFNRSKNAIETSLVSPAGAPKQYPNFFVSTTEAQNIETVRYTEDVMKDSGHLKMRVYFDPEALHIAGENFLTRDADRSINTSISQTGNYKFQIINIDRQKSAIVDLSLIDKRIPR